LQILGKFRVSSAWKPAAVAGLLVALYAGILARLARDWWNNPDYSYGLLVPPLALYIAWIRRRLTFSEPAAPNNYGLLLTAAGCLVLLVGKMGAEFFLTRISVVILLAGLVWTFWGGRRLRTLGCPLILLATMVPLPAIAYNLLAAPLQLFASGMASQIVQGAGVPVYREGNILHLAGMSLGVAEACSGLRSLSSLAVMALLIGFLRLDTLRSRATLFLLAVPVAISVNVVRIAATALLVGFNRDWALGFYHMFSGWLLFLAGLGLILMWASLLRYALEGVGPRRATV